MPFIEKLDRLWVLNRHLERVSNPQGHALGKAEACARSMTAHPATQYEVGQISCTWIYTQVGINSGEVVLSPIDSSERRPMFSREQPDWGCRSKGGRQTRNDRLEPDDQEIGGRACDTAPCASPRQG